MDNNINLIQTEASEYILVGSNNEEFNFHSFENSNITHKGCELDYQIKNEKGFVQIEYNGKKYTAEVINRIQNRIEVLINGVSYNFSIETPFSHKRNQLLKSKQGKNSIEHVKSPMPGKILDIMVEEGQEVSENDALLVLEAMKMQNEIKSNVSGKVKKINVKIEDAVMKDVVLVEIG
jgi:biotin carboxyl carrier protein